MQNLEEVYNDDFQKGHLAEKQIYAARTIVKIVLDKFKGIESVIDFGCGVGNYLAAFKEMGTSSVLGLDGHWANPKFLRISESELIKTDLENVSSVGKFDLAISLEVAEHLKKESAEHFIQTMTNSADLILFSAAIPFQGGDNHINEQWPDFWINLFANQGYFLFDFIREKIWNDEDIPCWYRQNIMMFVKKNSKWANGISETRNILPAICKDLFLAYSKSTSNWSLVCKWKRNLAKFNEKIRGLQFVAIWGGGIAGTLLYENLNTLGIKIECILDKNQKLNFPYLVSITHISQVSRIKSETIIVSILEKFTVPQEIISSGKRILFLKDLIEGL